MIVEWEKGSKCSTIHIRTLQLKRADKEEKHTSVPKWKMDVNTIWSLKEDNNNLGSEIQETVKCKSATECLYRQETTPQHLPCQEEHKGNFITHGKHINMTAV
jgi:hypothetical protein